MFYNVLILFIISALICLTDTHPTTGNSTVVTKVYGMLRNFKNDL